MSYNIINGSEKGFVVAPTTLFFQNKFCVKILFSILRTSLLLFHDLVLRERENEKKLFEIFGSLRFCNCLCTPHSHTPSKWLIKRGELRNILKCFANILD